MLGFHCLMQVRQYKYLQDHRGLVSSHRPSKERLHVALHCYNEIEIELFCTKWLIVDRLTEARLMSLRNLWLVLVYNLLVVLKAIHL